MVPDIFDSLRACIPVGLNLNQVLFKTVLGIMPVVNGFTDFLYHSLSVTGSVKYAPSTHPVDDFYCPAPELLAANKTIAAYLCSSLLVTFLL